MAPQKLSAAEVRAVHVTPREADVDETSIRVASDIAISPEKRMCRLNDFGVRGFIVLYTSQIEKIDAISQSFSRSNSWSSCGEIDGIDDEETTVLLVGATVVVVVIAVFRRFVVGGDG